MLQVCQLIFPLFHVTVSKILITNGWNFDGKQETSEIVDLTIKGSNKCKNWPDFPISVSGAVGGLIGNTVLICGGHTSNKTYVDACHSLTSQKATLVTHMSVGRDNAASIVLSGTILWVTGGSNKDNVLASTENVSIDGSMPGPNLLLAVEKHSIVAINSTSSMVIGGSPAVCLHICSFSTSSTFYYDHNKGNWFKGPSLMHPRHSHAAGIVTDEVTNENFVVVTGGSSSAKEMDSTEILQDRKWLQGNCVKSSHFLEILYQHHYHNISKLVHNNSSYF